MMNETFRFLSEKEKNTKFKAVLKRKTGGCLTDGEIQDILRTIIPNRQYEVAVYQDAAEFNRALTLGEGCRGRTVFGQAMTGSRMSPGRLFCVGRAAAVIVKNAGEEGVVYRLLIFIPQDLLQKGCQKI